MLDGSLGERVRAMIRTPDFWVFVIPFVYYVALIRFEITYGDGPELLIAAYKLGGPHPSGYPLFTLLGFIPSHLPWATPFWNLAVWLSALPNAIAVWAIYRTLRWFGAGGVASVVGALVWAFNYHVAYQATRIEVYALHCALVALAIYALARFIHPDPAPTGVDDSQKGRRIEWAYGAVLFTCLALTNHLTSAFLVIPVTIGMLLADHKMVLRPKPIAVMFGIAAGCASIYAYLPLQAMANDGDRISWNDPQTLERFWFHVSGQEYAIFRSFEKIVPTLEQFLDSLHVSFFSGVLIIAAIGAYDWILKGWRSLLCVVLFEASYLAYVATYPIRDLSTYYTALFIPIVLGFAMGLDWLLRMRFVPRGTPGKRRLHSFLEFVVLAVLGGWIVGLMVYSRANHYREALAEDMSAWAMADMQEPAVIFTSVDGHTFPMWYQTFMEHPDKKVATLDTIMFHLKNKQWYRDHLREAYPWINWPSDEVALGRNWRQWMLDNNPDINFYAILHQKWPSSKSYGVLKGWHHELHNGRDEANVASKRVRHAYLSRASQVNGITYFHTSQRKYVAGEERIACVIEWWDHKGFSASWTFYGPDGKKYDFPNHGIPENSNQSWEYLEPNQQKPGQWRCEVKAPNEPLIVMEFTLE